MEYLTGGLSSKSSNIKKNIAYLTSFHNVLLFKIGHTNLNGIFTNLSRPKKYFKEIRQGYYMDKFIIDPNLEDSIDVDNSYYASIKGISNTYLEEEFKNFIEPSLLREGKIVSELVNMKAGGRGELRYSEEFKQTKDKFCNLLFQFEKYYNVKIFARSLRNLQIDGKPISKEKKEIIRSRFLS